MVALRGSLWAVRVRSDRTFRFDAGPEAVWSAMADTGSYRRWWPWLRRFEAEGLVPGDVWRCTVKPPLPYVLRFTVTLDDVATHRIRATVGGDIEGSAVLDLLPWSGGSEARLVSDLAPRNGVLAVVAAAAAPVVRYGHDWVLDSGARQFAHRAL